jgi:RNA polymerase sigma-70 factor, ECF subfamily
MQDWDQILADHAGAVWRTAYRLLGNTADADEAMQEAFVDAVRTSGREVVRNLGALLRRLATVRSLDRLRRRMAEKGVVSGVVAWEAVPSRDDPPDGPAQGRELSDCLRRALGRLPTQQAQAFCLRHIEDLSYEDIADQLQVSVNSVGVILHRARERLRELLKELAIETHRVRCQP